MKSVYGHFEDSRTGFEFVQEILSAVMVYGAMNEFWNDLQEIGDHEIRDPDAGGSQLNIVIGLV